MPRSSGRGLLDEAPSRVFRRRRGHIGFLAAADPRAAGGGAAAPAASFDQVRDRGDCRGWRRIGRTGQGERRCGGLLRRAQDWIALTATGIAQPTANAAVTSEVAAVIGSEIRILSLQSLILPRSLATKKAPARGLHCRDHGEPTYGWAVRSLITSASNVASLTSYAA
jgi:hypothetical protein